MTGEEHLRRQLQAAMVEGQALPEEVRQLRETLTRHLIPLPVQPARIQPHLPSEQVAAAAAPATSKDKIALFRSLFRGREDVYAVRVQFRRDGKWGYVPDGEATGATQRPSVRTS